MTSAQPDFTASPEKMPVVFVGHGNPMNAIEDSEFSRAWEALGRSLLRPRAILCISAHWETAGTKVTAMESPRTIHDFGGFPPELYAQQYPAPGSPELAQLIQETVPEHVDLDLSWGLDHGAWSVLRRMFPQAGIPVVQLSLDRTISPAQHYQIGSALSQLRNQGVLIVGSGNIVHNLGMISWENRAHDWATEFDEKVRQLIVSGDHQSIVDYDRLGRSASLSIPTNEHFLPLLYVLGLKEEGEGVHFFAEGVTLGAISMRSLVVG